MQLFKILISLGLVANAVAENKIKIMLLGDSITELTCWRAMVWDVLVQEDLRYDVLFVGSKTSNARNCRARSGTFDLHHEGHHGILSINVANHYLEGWLASSKPDIVQIMLGTKDVSLGRPTSDIIDSYTEIIDLIRASNPRAKILPRLIF
ncbi:hypothetical protein FJTKL_03494 [Diaporthe vaccinii]|uniref:SGNH hydrolase-type esterase domain-containing protein n=1 Tax=Diaporthe vaccinii TaxID=105482 RepID=A0ABR4F2D6_9PEZI